MRHIDELALVVRRRREHLVGVFVLKVEHARQRQRGLPEFRVLERVCDLLALEPDLALALAQPFQELLASARALRLLDVNLGHQSPPAGSGCPSASSPWRSASTAAESKRK